eukprot:scaffold13206_cov67-Phaeocystis_antarctica.AAC.4
MYERTSGHKDERHVGQSLPHGVGGIKYMRVRNTLRWRGLHVVNGVDVLDLYVKQIVLGRTKGKGAYIGGIYTGSVLVY